MVQVAFCILFCESLFWCLKKPLSLGSVIICQAWLFRAFSNNAASVYFCVFLCISWRPHIVQLSLLLASSLNNRVLCLFIVLPIWWSAHFFFFFAFSMRHRVWRWMCLSWPSFTHSVTLPPLNFTQLLFSGVLSSIPTLPPPPSSP